MFKKISIRMKLTLLCVFLLTTCCVGLTTILNLSANKMADVIEAIPISPAISIDHILQSKNDAMVMIDSATYSTETLPTDAQNGTIKMAPLVAPKTSQIARKSFLYESILYMTVIIFVGGLLTYYISGKTLRPLHELSNQMKNLTVHNLSENLELPQANDEITDLTYAFNEMSNKLDEAFSMQKRFSQSAAHELRTPLAVLKTKIEVFHKKENHTWEEYDSLVHVISTHTNRLSYLVKDLLDFTNMDLLEYNQTICLKKLLESIVEELQSLAKEKNISIILNGIEQTMQGNETLLHRAFYNLIENAIKYNSENGMVDITICKHEKNIEIYIKDTGIGIPEDKKELIFEPFFRIDKSRSRQMGGAGLGLSIVKNIIDMHHGMITVSKTPDGGSCFLLTCSCDMLPPF